jgi:glycosyltransferase involved in cell wall biosynthesis
LKIAHINNISGIGSDLSQAQILQGHLSDVYVFNPKIYNQFGGTMINYRSPFSRWKVFRKLKEYDIWHYHYPYGSLKAGLEKRNQGKIYLKHYHGDDLRGKSDDDFCLVSTPDLLKYAQNGKWLPSPVCIDKLLTVTENRDGGRLRVAHYPYYKMYGHLDIYSEILDSLQKTGKCDVVRILDVSHRETLRLISTCDIVLGKIIPNIGWFGRFELEGMALGKPVIAYISDDLYDKYKPPVFITTNQNFRQDLEALLEDTSVQHKLAKEGIQYVKEYHSTKKIVETLQNIYRQLGSY